jgi:aryl-alcohol dehydrogenase-like predicted oxidoreductase
MGPFGVLAKPNRPGKFINWDHDLHPYCRPCLSACIFSPANFVEILPDGMQRAELILRFTLAHPHCDTTIIGTCNPLHLTENLTAAAAGPLPLELHQQIASRVAALDN